MELKTAIEILEYHQQWRLGKREDMIHEPKKLTEALDIVLSEIKKCKQTMNLQKLHDHMAGNYDLLLLETEMLEIIDVVKEIIAQDESKTMIDNHRYYKRQ